MVTSDSNRSKSDGDEEQADNSRTGDDLVTSGGEFGQMIKDRSDVTGGKE